MTSRYLFVYGTLKRRSRHPMAWQLANSASFVGEATIAGRLYNLGRFPGLKEPRSFEDCVHGDVYDLGDNADAVLREMDAYENAESPPPTPYERELATVRLSDDREMLVWVYWYCGGVDETNFIASGSFESNCDPVESPIRFKKLFARVAVFGIGGGLSGLIMLILFVPTITLITFFRTTPLAAFDEYRVMKLAVTFALGIFPTSGVVAGLVAGLLPPKYQQPKSLVSFGASIFGMISIFLLWLLGFRTLTAVSVIISIFLALGALYGLLLSVSARFLARQFPSKEL